MAHAARLYMLLVMAGVHIGYLKGSDTDGYTDWGEKVGLELQTKDTERYFTTDGASKLNNAPLSQQPTAQAGLNEGESYGTYVDRNGVQDPQYLDPAHNYNENRDTAIESFPENRQGAQPGDLFPNVQQQPYSPQTGYSDPYKQLSPQYPQGAEVEALPQPREELAQVQLPPNADSQYVANQEETRVYDQQNANYIGQYPPIVHDQQPAAGQPPSVVNLNGVPQPTYGEYTELQHQPEVRGEQVYVPYQGVQPSSQQAQFGGSLLPENQNPVQQGADPSINGPQQVNPQVEAPQNLYQAAPGYPTLQEQIPSVPLNTETERRISDVNSQFPAQPVEAPAQGYPVYNPYPQVNIPGHLQTQDEGINQFGGISETQSELPEHIYPQNLFPGGNGLFAPNMAETPAEQAPTVPETARTMESPGPSNDVTQNDTTVADESLQQASSSQFDPMTGTQDRTLDHRYPDNTDATADGQQYVPQNIAPTNQVYDAYGRPVPVPPSQPETYVQPIPERPYPLTGSNLQNAEYLASQQQQQQPAPEQYPSPSSNKYIYPEQMGFSQNETRPLLSGGSYANSPVQEDQQGTADGGYQYQGSPYGQEQQQPAQVQPDLHRPLTQGQDLPNPMLPQQLASSMNVNPPPTDLQGQPLPSGYVNEPVSELTRQGLPVINETLPEIPAPPGAPVYKDGTDAVNDLDLSTVADTTDEYGTTEEPELDDEMTQWLKDFGDEEKDAEDYNGDNAEYSEDEGYKYSDGDEDDEYDDEYTEEEEDVDQDKDTGPGQEIPAFEDQDQDIVTDVIKQSVSSSSTVQTPSTMLPGDKPVVHGNDFEEDIPFTGQQSQNIWPSQPENGEPYQGQPIAPPSSDNLPSSGQIIAPSTGNNIPIPQAPMPQNIPNQGPYPTQQFAGGYIQNPQQPMRLPGMQYPYQQVAPLSDNSWPSDLQSPPQLYGNQRPHTEHEMEPPRIYNSPYPQNEVMPSSDRNIPYSDKDIPQYGDRQYFENMKLINKETPEQPLSQSGTVNVQGLDKPLTSYSGNTEHYPSQPGSQYGENQGPKYPEYIDQDNTQNLNTLGSSSQDKPQYLASYSDTSRTYPGQSMPQYGTYQLPHLEQPVTDNDIPNPSASTLHDNFQYSEPHEGKPETYSDENDPKYGDKQVPNLYANNALYPGQYTPLSADTNIQFPEKAMAPPTGDSVFYPEEAVLPSDNSLGTQQQEMSPSEHNYPPNKDEVMVPGLPFPSGDQTFSEQKPMIPSSIPYPDQPVFPSSEQHIQYPEAVLPAAQENKHSPDQPITNSGGIAYSGEPESIPYPGQPILPVGEDMKQPLDSIPYPGQPANIQYPDQPILPSNEQKNIQYPGEAIFPAAEETEQNLDQPTANLGEVAGKPDIVPYPGQPILSAGEDMNQPVGSVPYLGQAGSIQYPNMPTFPNLDNDLPSALQPALMPSVTTEIHPASPTGVISNTPVLPTDAVGTLGYDMAASSIPEASSSGIGISPTIISSGPDGAIMTAQTKLPEIHPIDTALFKIPEGISPERQQELIRQQQLLLKQQNEQISLQQEAQQLMDDQNTDHLNLPSSDQPDATTTEPDGKAATSEVSTEAEGSTSTSGDSTTASTQPTSEGSVVRVMPSEQAQTETALESGIRIPDFDHSDDEDEDEDGDKSTDRFPINLGNDEKNDAKAGATTTVGTDESTEPTTFPPATDVPGDDDMMDKLEGPDPDYEGPPAIPSGSNSLEAETGDSEDDEEQSTKKTKTPSVKMADMQKEAMRYPEPDQPGAGHFMGYFVTCIVFVVLGYLFYHNRKKVMGVLVEGRNGNSGRRGRNGNYKQLAVNVEEGLPSDEKSGKDFIY